MIEIYTDASPGPNWIPFSGIAVVTRDIFICHRPERKYTPSDINRLEHKAVEYAAMKFPNPKTINTDSQTVFEHFRKKSNHEYEVKWLKRNSHPLNELADALATISIYYCNGLRGSLNGYNNLYEFITLIKYNERYLHFKNKYQTHNGCPKHWHEQMEYRDIGFGEPLNFVNPPY